MFPFGSLHLSNPYCRWWCTHEHLSDLLANVMKLHTDGQIVPDSHFPRIWKEAFYKADVTKRRTEIDAFNKSNRWVKRGLSILPTMYGVNFPVNMLNQVGALVLVYTDGTVLVSHGGVEMGQGLNTKMAQIAAQAFGISTDKVHVGSTDSDKVPNNPPTAASYGADLNGMAVLNACQKINARLQPLRERYPEKLGGVRTPTLEAVSHSPSVVLVDQLLAEMAEGARPQCFLVRSAHLALSYFRLRCFPCVAGCKLPETL